MKRQTINIKQEQGQSMVEYVLIIGLIALVLFAAVIMFSQKTGSATCTKVDESNNIFTRYKYNKNSDTGIKAIYENVTCILGGWQNENVISDADIKLNGPTSGGVIPIASEIIHENKNYKVDEIKWDWVDKNGNSPHKSFSSKHDIKENIHKNHGRAKDVPYQNFYWTKDISNTYVATVKLKAKKGFQFAEDRPIELSVTNNYTGGALIRESKTDFISKDEVKITIYYEKMTE